LWFEPPIVAGWDKDAGFWSTEDFHDLKFNEEKQVFIIQLHIYLVLFIMETAVAQWLRCCATNRKVTGSIPAGASGFFIDIKSFQSHYGPGVDSASNINEHQEYFLGVKAADA